MNIKGNSKAKFCIQSEKHPLQTSVGLCSLMEHQSLVDIAICCGNNTLHAHKVVLAANSPLFREELEKNSCIEQVIVSGCDFSVMKSIIEFMYCGETTISEDYLKYLVAAAKLFQMKSLENLSLERADCQFSGDVVVLPKPQFLSKKPKYPAYQFNTNSTLTSNNILKPINYNVNNMYKPHKVKRKFRLEAEHQACMKEAQASRLAIANLKKEIASAPQANTFIIEETCTETTVENFIPHADQTNFVEVDYNNIDNQVFISSNQFNQETVKSTNMLQLALQNNGQALTADKIKHILGNEVPSNVEIMFKTSDGNFVTVTDEVLQNLSTKDGLQYQVVDENGHIGEVQELQVLERETLEKVDKIDVQNTSKNISNHDSNLTSVTSPEEYISTHFLEAHEVGSTQILFNTNNQVTEDIRESNNISLETTKSFTDDSLFESHNLMNGNIKNIQLIQQDSVDFKPTILENGQCSDIISCENSYYTTMCKEESNKSVDGDRSEESIIGSVNEEYKVAEIPLISPRKTRSSLKFSPDMFFADIPNNNADGHINEPDQKKSCQNRKRKV